MDTIEFFVEMVVVVTLGCGVIAFVWRAVEVAVGFLIKKARRQS